MRRRARRANDKTLRGVWSRWIANWTRPSSFYLIAIAALVTGTPLVAKPQMVDQHTTFTIGNRTFTGRNASFCVIEGQWNDGAHLRHVAWDRCDNLRVRRASVRANNDRRGPGRAKNCDAGDDGEAIEISNEHSSVMIMRDRSGKLCEVLTRD